jgi:type VI secretion system protein VasD
MVGAGLALLATWPELAQADSIATQTRLGNKRWNFIWLSLGEIKRHYWRAISAENCVTSTKVPRAIAPGRNRACACSACIDGDPVKCRCRLIYQRHHAMATTPLSSRLTGFLCCLLLAGCAGGAGSSPAGLLEVAGLRKPPPVPEAQLPPRNVALRLHAAKRLNVDPRGQSLALLVRIYKLRQRTAFEQAPYSAFLSPQSEREALGADLVEVRELTLVPGQQLELNEKLPREAGWLGVVALFYSPPPQGWRLAIAAPEAERAGVTIGLHACAMSSAAGASKPLSLVRCQ